ncbi:hypothetical protein GCM10020000_07130 [Streptomyces olivoverticillatus]
MRYAVVGGVQGADPYRVAPAAEDLGVLLPQWQHVWDLFHAHPLGSQVVQPAHRFGGEDAPLVLTGRLETRPGVAAVGEVVNGLVYERLVGETETLA